MDTLLLFELIDRIGAHLTVTEKEVYKSFYLKTKIHVNFWWK